MIWMSGQGCRGLCLTCPLPWICGVPWQRAGEGGGQIYSSKLGLPFSGVHFSQPQSGLSLVMLSSQEVLITEPSLCAPNILILPGPLRFPRAGNSLELSGLFYTLTGPAPLFLENHLYIRPNILKSIPYLITFFFVVKKLEIKKNCSPIISLFTMISQQSCAFLRISTEKN